MADIKAILDWADEVCETAMTEARKGDTSLVNHLSGGMKLYFDNVYAIKSVKRDAFAAYYPGQFKEVTRLYEEYQRDELNEANVAKIGTLEQSLAEFKALLEAQAEQIKALTEAKKPASKKPVKPGPDAEPEADTEADAESEA